MALGRGFLYPKVSLVRASLVSESRSFPLLRSTIPVLVVPKPYSMSFNPFDQWAFVVTLKCRKSQFWFDAAWLQSKGCKHVIEETWAEMVEGDNIWYLCISTICSNLSSSKQAKTQKLRTSPAGDDPKFAAWDEEDSMIMSRLLNLMKPDIRGTYMFLSTSKETSRFNVDFDQIRVQVLGRETISSLNQTFSVIVAEESHIMVMLEPKITKGSALMSMKPNKEGFRNQQQNLNLVPNNSKSRCFGILSLRSQTIRRRHGGSHMGSIQEQGMKVIGRKVTAKMIGLAKERDGLYILEIMQPELDGGHGGSARWMLNLNGPNEDPLQHLGILMNRYPRAPLLTGLSEQAKLSAVIQDISSGLSLLILKFRKSRRTSSGFRDKKM
ncbi:hypothetical protein Sango_2471100 [Sesamum angolense]|uniref:Uncharacterized protein n=1 Tax=Sesamum angolense TaxID=2727404 RepID=A0AAE1W3A9_9LAMI|nr:hypothetical protein Sango_2471100 [Sesamum angolense]